MTTFMNWMLPTRGVGRRSPTWCRNNGLRGHSIRDEDVTPLTGEQAESGQRGDNRWAVSWPIVFAALFAMYFTIRSVDKGQGLPWPGADLNLALSTVNTVVLLLSSVTCQLGVFAVERGQIKRTGSIWNMGRWGLREWYVLSFLMGLYFICGQGYEYLQLIREGLTLASSGYGSVFFIPTGFHGLHVTGGLIAF